MHKIVFLLFLSICGIKSFSQQQYFLYIQADERQPFYARLNAKIYSSSENGYLIIPRLGDSAYSVTIGFARNLYPEQQYTIAINKEDKGFQLKKTGDKAWNLYNLQTMTPVQGSVLREDAQSNLTGVKKTDAFSQLLANVVNDSSVLYSLANTEEPAKKKKTAPANRPEDSNKTITNVHAASATQQPVEPKSTDSTAQPSGIAAAENKNEPASPSTSPVASANPADKQKPASPDREQDSKEAVEKPFITKLSERKDANVYEAVYLEQYMLTTDTIRIIIAMNEASTAASLPDTPAKSADLPTEQKPDSTETTASAPIATPPTDQATEKKVSAVVLTNSDCKAIASEHEVDKLRVRLLAQEAMDDKLAAARKFFKTRCLLVKQLAALTELFATDETRYRFFDTAYPFVSDTGNFYTLEALIQNDYYKTRFKAMIHK